jgi:uncharacterized protein YceH (UPF0502 family)
VVPADTIYREHIKWGQKFCKEFKRFECVLLQCALLTTLLVALRSFRVWDNLPTLDRVLRIGKSHHAKGQVNRLIGGTFCRLPVGRFLHALRFLFY